MGDKQSDFIEAAGETGTKEDRLLGALIAHWANIMSDTEVIRELEDRFINEEANDPDDHINIAQTTLRLANSLAALSETALTLRDRIVPEELARPVGDETADQSSQKGRTDSMALKKH